MDLHRPKILVVGSLVMDLITSTSRIPAAGETVIGRNFSTAPGGKGANQAVQAARLGAQVTMVGKVGTDIFGRELIRSLSSAGVDTSHILEDKDTYSAVGNVQLLVDGDRTLNNRIIVASGANHRLSADDVSFLKEDISNYDMVILQLEIPQAINELVARWAHAKGVPVMLNPAPSAPLSHELLSHLTYISPNEHEAADLTGTTLFEADGRLEQASLDKALDALHRAGVPNVIITMGSRGSILSSPQGKLVMPCVPGVNAIDPTAAGDSFLGAFCTAAAAGLGMEESMSLATYTAAITVSGMGAQPSLPTFSQVLDSMSAHGCAPSLLNSICQKL